MVQSDINKLASEINSLGVQSYLKNTGWSKVQSKVEHLSIFIKDKGTTFREILLPLTRKFNDYNSLILNAIDSIAFIEDKEPIQILSDLLIAKPADVIRFRLVNDDTKEGTISFDDGFKLLENARMALYATACDVTQPDIYHKRLSFKAPDQFIDQCRLGQTERGSFVTSIICPFVNESKIDDKPKQFSLFDSPNEYVDSFTRRVTKQLMKSINVINKSIENDELDKIQNGEAEVLMSANFLESIVNIKQLNKDSSSIEFISSWSSLAPIIDSGIPSKIEVQKDFVSAIDSVIDKMIPKNIKEPGEFVGRVSLLKADPDVKKRTEGEVTLNLIGSTGNDKSFSAKAILDAQTYLLACKAHEEGKNILIKGDLVSGRNSKIIENPVFTIINQDNFNSKPNDLK